jgi:enterochelin esterase-like enzyme
LGAILGAGGAFFFGYLLGFIQLELQPVSDPGGHLEPLNGSVLVHNASIMFALAFLCAFIGAGVGNALAEVLWEPLFQLAQFLGKRNQTQKLPIPVTQTSKSRKLLFSLLGTLAMIVLIVLASGASDLLRFSPDVGLRVAPALPNGQSYVYGTVVQDEVTSAALGGQKKPFLVYLPPSYMTPQGSTKRYPTLYLLHGSPGTDIDWLKGGKADQSANTLISLGKIPDLIMILPDGNGRSDAPSEWGNSPQQNIETYIASDLVTYVDKKYRTIPDLSHRAIGGLSMGGFGAANIGIHHPDVFGTIIALGGYYRAEGPVWGNNAALLQENSPLLVLPNKQDAWKSHFFLGAATKDQPYNADTKQFAQELTNLHIPYTFDLEDGSHSWAVWQIQLYHALLWLHWG